MTLFDNLSKSQQLSQNQLYEGNLSGKIVLNLRSLSTSNLVAPSNDNRDLIGVLKLILDKQMAMNSGKLPFYVTTEIY